LLQGNGYLAVYIAGLVVGNNKLVHKHTLTTFFDSFTWLCQVIMFLTLGLLVNVEELLQFDVVVLGCLVGAFMIFVARPLAVFTCLAPFRQFSRKARLYISWVGLRGAVPIIFATYPVVEHIDGAEMLFNIVFFVTLISMAVQGTTVSGMANALGLAFEERESSFGEEMREYMQAAFSEVEVNEQMLISGNKLSDIVLPDNTLVVMICRDGDYFVPRGHTELLQEDKLLILSDRSDELDSQYKELGIDPMTKSIVFSDSLNFEKCVQIKKACEGRIKCMFGIGTNLTCDTGHASCNIVMKLSSCQINSRQPIELCVKLSDVEGKEMGDPQEVAVYRYLLRNQSSKA
jgi:cell volume regulation protein A